MSFLTAVPELVSRAAQDLAGIGSALESATSSAAALTTSLLPAGLDEISSAVAALFSSHGEGYLDIAAKTSAFQ